MVQILSKSELAKFYKMTIQELKTTNIVLSTMTLDYITLSQSELIYKNDIDYFKKVFYDIFQSSYEKCDLSRFPIDCYSYIRNKKFFDLIDNIDHKKILSNILMIVYGKNDVNLFRHFIQDGYAWKKYIFRPNENFLGVLCRSLGENTSNQKQDDTYDIDLEIFKWLLEMKYDFHPILLKKKNVELLEYFKKCEYRFDS